MAVSVSGTTKNTEPTKKIHFVVFASFVVLQFYCGTISM